MPYAGGYQSLPSAASLDRVKNSLLYCARDLLDVIHLVGVARRRRIERMPVEEWLV